MTQDDDRDDLDAFLRSVTVVDDYPPDATVLCVREGTETPFTDNETSPCSECGHTVIHRPHVPKTATKVCMECMMDRINGGRA